MGLKIKGRGLQGIQELLRKVEAGDFKRAHSPAARAMSHRMAEVVRAEYRKQSTLPVGLTRRAILMGKEAGASNPAREPRSARSALAILADNVVVTKVREGYRIQIDPDATHPDPHSQFPQGVPLSLLAHWIENPTPRVIPWSKRMLAYIIGLREGRMGLGTRKVARHMPAGLAPGAGPPLVIDPKPRPVWRNAAAQVAGLAKLFSDDLRQRWQRMVAASRKA